MAAVAKAVASADPAAAAAASGVDDDPPGSLSPLAPSQAARSPLALAADMLGFAPGDFGAPSEHTAALQPTSPPQPSLASPAGGSGGRRQKPECSYIS